VYFLSSKGKVVPLHAMVSCGEVEVRLHWFSTSALVDASVYLNAPADLPLGKKPSIPF